MVEFRNVTTAIRALVPARPLMALVAMIAFVLAALPARAELQIDIGQGNVEPLPIAITDFVGGTEKDSKVGADISSVITNNLERSGLFRPLPKASFIEKISDINV